MDKQQRQREFVNSVLSRSPKAEPLRIFKQHGQGLAPVNIALSKYWGKRDAVLNLPMNGSLSISLPTLGTRTKLEVFEGAQDDVSLNHKPLASDNGFCRRVSAYLDLFRPTPNTRFRVNTYNSVPTAAGLASSASGYAALVLALNDLFEWQLDQQSLSLLARLGSGSASRSLFNGFAQWHAGERDDGLDSYAEAVEQTWPELCIGLVKVDTAQKPIGSTEGMQNTVNHCDLYQPWPQKAEQDKAKIFQAIQEKDFSTLGQVAENNALAMHATMIATWPPILYWQPESVLAMQKVWQLRQDGVEVYFTMDAGPNLKLLMLEKNVKLVLETFEHKIDILRPFVDDAN